MKNFEHIQKIRKTIDKIAYCSLFLDVCIAIVTTLSILHIGNPEAVLIPLSYMLTIVVVLSIGLFITLVALRHEENILVRLINGGFTYRYKPKTNSYYKPVTAKKMRWAHRDSNPGPTG